MLLLLLLLLLLMIAAAVAVPVAAPANVHVAGLAGARRDYNKRQHICKGYAYHQHTFRHHYCHHTHI